MNCPLCKKELIQANDNYQQYHCPTTTPDLSNVGLRFHYYRRTDGRAYIYVGLYRIHLMNQFIVYKFITDDESDGGGYYKKVLDVPEFKIKSEKQLLHKLNTLVVFS